MMSEEGYYGDCRDNCDAFYNEGTDACKACAAIMHTKEYQDGAACMLFFLHFSYC